jgi:hypothetical protein
MKNHKKKTSFEIKQAVWEWWFISALIIFLAYMFVGTLDNSREFLPNWLPFALISIFNLLASIIVGVRGSNDEL